MKYNLELNRANIILGSGEEITNAIWGAIKGDITEQKDLQQELTDIKESIPDLTQVKEDIASLESDITGLVTKQELESKVDKIEGYSLMPDTEINRLSTVTNYDDTAINNNLKNKVTISYLGDNYYKKTEVDKKIDEAIAGNVDLSGYYTKAEIDAKGYLTSETDPTISNWAKQPNKPTYTASEVGALPDTTVIPDITGLATKQELTTGLADKADISSVYTKSEVDLKLGNIDTILDFINGEVI